MTESLYLLSNASTDIFENTLTKFTNHFGDNPLRFDPRETWQIGLDALYLHPRFPNIPVLGKGVPHLRIYNNDEIGVTGIIDERTKHSSVCLPYYQYSTASLVWTINQTIKNLGLEDKITFIYPFVGQTANGDPTLIDRLQLFTNEHTVLFQVDLAVSLGLVEHRDLSYKNRVKLFSTDYFRYTPPAVGEAHPFKASYEVRLVEQIPKIIKVQIDNVESAAENDSHVFILSYHAVNMISAHMHYKQFINPLYLTLSSNHINSFTVKLLDEQNNQLKLDESLPTILKMSLRRFDTSSGEFHVVIDSSRFNANHPNNTGTDFAFSMNPPVQLEEDYECGISSITYSTFFKSVPIPPSEAYIKVTRKDEHGAILGMHSLIFNPKQKPLMSIEDVISVLNENAYVRRGDNPKAKLFQHAHKSFEGRCMLFKIASENATAYVNIGGFPYATYDFPMELAKILGANVHNANTADNRWVLSMTPEKGQPVKELFAKKFDFPPNIITLIPQTLFIYTNFTRGVQLGPDIVNLLQIVPIKSNAVDRHKNNYITMTFDRPNWVQVSTRHLKDLRFKILRSDGKAIDFEDQSDGVLITLLFRKKQDSSWINRLF